MEKIEIKDFLGIKDITIEVKQINIFIGSQASGKSAIAKLLYYFKGFVSEIIGTAKQLSNEASLNKNYLQKFKQYFPPSSWGKHNFRIKYWLNNEYIEVSRNESDLELNYSNVYKDKFDEFKSFAQAVVKNRNETKLGLSINSGFPSIRLQELSGAFSLILSEDIDYRVAFTQRYIPAGRSFFANLENNIFFLLDTNNTIEPFLIEFGRYYEQIKAQADSQYTLREVGDGNLYDELEEMSCKIVCGKYLRENNKDYLELEDNRRVSIINSSSGQQETLPLTLILGIIAHDQPDIGGDSIYIEEPEAHIFPATQKNIVELIATVYNARKNSLQFVLTTHSPYILTSFNNLLQAGMLAIDADEEKIKAIEKLVPKSRFIQPGEIAVYSVADGYCKSIMDESTGLIDANIIDEVSNELAVQFDELLDLEE